MIDRVKKMWYIYFSYMWYIYQHVVHIDVELKYTEHEASQCERERRYQYEKENGNIKPMTMNHN